MTDNDKTIPVWVDNDGVKTQVGWATPNDGTGVRKINLLDGFDNTALKNVRFGDIDPFETELNPAETQEPPRTYEDFASEPFVDIDGEVLEPALDESEDFESSGVTVVTQDAEIVVEDVPDEELAAEPIDEGVAPEVVEAEIEPEEEIDPLLDEYGFEVWTQEDADALDDDSDETEDLPEGFEPAAAVQEESEQSEDPAQP